MTQAETYDAIVIGGGAAGLMCAIEAGKRARSVLLLESNDEIGRKILISGGGRCNFTNIHAGPENYLSSNPDFCRSALARYTPAHFIDLVERCGIRYHEKKLGQLFCDGSARNIVDMLLAECRLAGVDVRSGCSVRSVEASQGFTVQTNLGAFKASSLVVATGGISVPKIGATDFAYRLARQFGLPVIEPRPGLVPFTFDEPEHSIFAGLSGVSIDAVVTCGGQSFRENVLFTHRGLSGPAVLQTSSFWSPGMTISIDLLPDADDDVFAYLSAGPNDRRELATVLAQHLPRRFVNAWCQHYVSSRPVSSYSAPEREGLSRTLHDWRLLPSGTEGFARAEVTVGGVDTRELSSRTMETRRIPGLYFIGEAVDVTGWLGGYNFQWAWASGFAAGQSL